MMNSTRAWVCILLIGVALGGCQNAAKGRVPVYKAKGKVTYLGNAVIGAVVTFVPQESQPVAIARTNDLGEFTLTTYGGGDGAAAGEYKVTVMLPDATGDAPPASSGSHDETLATGGSHSAAAAKSKTGSLLPEKFSNVEQTSLTAKIEAGGANNFPFDLK